jgi:prophage antirepressor-like protein
MTNAMQLFKFEGNEIRGTIIDGEPVVCAKDIAEALGFKRPNDAVNQHCKGTAIHRPLSTSGGVQNVRFLREPDVYRLILRSNLPSAEKFQDWVCEELLPQLRRTGIFVMAGEDPAEVGELIALEYRCAALRKRIEAKELECKAKLVQHIEGSMPIIDWVREHCLQLNTKQCANVSRAIKRAVVGQLRKPVGATKGSNGGKVMAATPSDIEAAFALILPNRPELQGPEA